MASASSDLNEHPAVRRVHELSKGSACLEKTGARNLAIACEAAKEVLGARFNDLVREAGGRPLLSSKSCDSTPVNVKKKTKHTPPGGKATHGSGRASHEFLCKLQFVRCIDGAGACQTTALMEEATALLHASGQQGMVVLPLSTMPGTALGCKPKSGSSGSGTATSLPSVHRTWPRAPPQSRSWLSLRWWCALLVPCTTPRMPFDGRWPAMGARARSS
eukprot:9393108-Lingulodinium_polyedra.AAC.1